MSATVTLYAGSVTSVSGFVKQNIGDTNLQCVDSASSIGGGHFFTDNPSSGGTVPGFVGVKFADPGGISNFRWCQFTLTTNFLKNGAGDTASYTEDFGGTVFETNVDGVVHDGLIGGVPITKSSLFATAFGLTDSTSTHGSTTTHWTLALSYYDTATFVSCTASSGTAAGGTTVSVVFTDTDPSTVTAVRFGTTAATGLTNTGLNTYTCVTPAHSAGVVDVHADVLYNDGTTDTITLTNGYTYTLNPFTLSSIPAALIEDAQSLTDIIDSSGTVTSTALTQFKATWDAQVGSAYSTWLYYKFKNSNISVVTALTIHWYTFSASAPGTLWVSTSTPSPNGWFQSTDGFASSANLIIGDAPHNPRSFTEMASFAAAGAGMLGGFPGTGVNFRNHFIYASGGYTVGTDSPSLRIFDGLSDRSITSIPNTSAGVVPKAIVSMILVGETIYLTTFDSGTSAADFAGRVFSFQPLTGAMAQIGSGFGSGELPYALCWHMNRLWLGTNKGTGAGGKIYFFRPNIDSSWTTDYTLSTSSVGGACSLVSYQGQLYVGSDNSAGNFALVLVRSALGAYTTALTATGGTARVNNGFLSMIVFSPNLYATYWNPDTTAVAKIYKYDGTTWTTPYTGASGLLRPYIGQYVTNNTMLTIGGGDVLSATLLSTTDGTTYTDRTSSLIGTSTASPVFGEVVI